MPLERSANLLVLSPCWLRWLMLRFKCDILVLNLRFRFSRSDTTRSENYYLKRFVTQSFVERMIRQAKCILRRFNHLMNSSS